MANLLRRPPSPVDQSIDLSRILLYANPGSENASRLRSLAQEILAKTHGLRRLAIVPIDQGRASRLIANIAYALAEAQHRIALVEADLRLLQIATRFRLPASTIGLAEVLEDKAPLAAAEFQVNPWLTIIPGGQVAAEAPGLLNLPRFGEILRDVSERNDLSLVFCPPASHYLDYSFVAKSCDAIVIVAQKDKSRMAKILTVRDQIERLGVPIVYAMLEHSNF